MGRFFAAVFVLSAFGLVGASASAGGERPLVSSTDPGVTVYGATWCGPCKLLEHGLRERKIPFDLIDVDENPKAYDVARRATGQNVVPITSVSKGADVSWIVGADVDAVEKAYLAGG
jgi:glutaredoxin